MEHCTDALIPIAIAEKYKTLLYSHLNTCLEQFYFFFKSKNTQMKKVGLKKNKQTTTHTLFEVFPINFKATDHKKYKIGFVP